MNEPNWLFKYNDIDLELCPTLKNAGYTTPGWYFWDEVQAGIYGPYESYEEAAVQMTAYIKTL